MINDVIKRVVAAQPEIMMANHEGYYRHADVVALVSALSVRDATLKEIERLANDTTVGADEAFERIAGLATEGRL